MEANATVSFRTVISGHCLGNELRGRRHHREIATDDLVKVQPGDSLPSETTVAFDVHDLGLRLATDQLVHCAAARTLYYFGIANAASVHTVPHKAIGVPALLACHRKN